MYFSTSDIQVRRDKLSQYWNTLLREDEAVLVYAGSPVPKPGGLDQQYPFIPHPAYYWLTGRRREDEVILYAKNTGWIAFQKTYSKEQAVWEGEKDDQLVVQPGQDIHQLNSFLATQKFAAIYSLGQSNQGTPSGKAYELRTLLDQTRRKKDAAEIHLIKHIAAIAASGYEKIQQLVQPGISEREIQIAFEAEIFRQGAHTVPYDTIVGSGVNSAILHALPTQKIVRENEWVLVDAGAAVLDYCVDITRVFPSTAETSSQQKSLYQLVLSVQQACMAMAKPGVYWRDVHLKAAGLFTEGLQALGILKGNVSQLIEKEVAAVFFPHGLGHLVGLHVRDTGHEENLEPKTYFGSRLRVDIQLEEHHLLTVEPGLYFIKALLEDSETKKRFKEDISWTELEKWKDLGGVRIEDNILITQTGNENLTIGVVKPIHL